MIINPNNHKQKIKMSKIHKIRVKKQNLNKKNRIMIINPNSHKQKIKKLINKYLTKKKHKLKNLFLKERVQTKKKLKNKSQNQKLLAKIQKHLKNEFNVELLYLYNYILLFIKLSITYI
jgi:hypothetical protein